MDNPILQMRYHPAKKEVEFRRFMGTKNIGIKADSALTKYMMEEKGEFILQNHGNSFFDDIVEAFSGQTEIEIKVLTTKADFEDFQQMVEYYNKTTKKNCRIRITPGRIGSDETLYLSDMDQIFQSVRDAGWKAENVLRNQKACLEKISSDKENVEASIADVGDKLEEARAKIEHTVQNLGDSQVDLCFTGVYSTGKSELINALLGYRILPTSKESKTARVFRIRSPRKGEESVEIRFTIRDVKERLVWDKVWKGFKIKTLSDKSQPIDENDLLIINHLMDEIKECINRCKCEKYPQHEQICKLLDLINDDEDIGSSITVLFPVPLDNERVQFTILDTPGTDSDYEADQEILRKAFAKRKNSILIFVTKLDRMEGTGIHTLLSYLHAGQKECKTAIDLSRSLFVINAADDTTLEERENAYRQVLKDSPKSNMEDETEDKAEDGPKNETEDEAEDENMSINLAEQKLLFTSARYANVANAKKNNIAMSDDDEEFFETAATIKFKKPDKAFYRQNRCATSEYATEQMVARSDKALQEAMRTEDEARKIYVAAGLYALENEMKLYGGKYAPAVRANGIIDSIEDALSKVERSVDSLVQQSDEDLTRIDKEITALHEDLCKDIHAAVEEYLIGESGIKPADLVNLELNDARFSGDEKSCIRKQIETAIKNAGLRNDKDRKADKKGEKQLQKVVNNVSNIFDKEIALYCKNREDRLKDYRTKAMKAIEDAIKKRGDLDPYAVNLICAISPPAIKRSGNIDTIKQIYKRHIYTKRVLWMDKNYLKTEKFKADTKVELENIWKLHSRQCQDDYIEGHNNLIKEIVAEYIQNLDRASVLLRAKLEDKAAMAQLHQCIDDTAKSLKETIDNLNAAIWKEKKEGKLAAMKNAVRGFGNKSERSSS